MRRGRGFTLIELMMVVAIIGLITAIAVPNFMSSRHRAYEASVRANMHTIQVSVEDFAALAEGFYPGTIDTRVGEVLLNLGYSVPAGWQGMVPFRRSLADGKRRPPFTPYALLHPHQGFFNPFSKISNAVDNIGGPPAVPPAGCSYYTGYDESGVKGDGEPAIGYSICGYGKDRSLALILSSGH